MEIVGSLKDFFIVVFGTLWIFWNADLTDAAQARIFADFLKELSF
jgi:hypothetical protein